MSHRDKDICPFRGRRSRTSVKCNLIAEKNYKKKQAAIKKAIFGPPEPPLSEDCMHRCIREFRQCDLYTKQMEK